MSADGLSEALDAYRRGDLTPQQVAAREQQQLAVDGRAINQCPSCGSYRLDGAPPILHRDDCGRRLCQCGSTNIRPDDSECRDCRNEWAEYDR